MCTVVVVSGSGGRLILAGNRDELRTRPRAEPPVIEEIDGVGVVWPRDPEGGGTWTAGTSRGLAFSLLNYYELPYNPSDPVSRGLVIPHLVTSPDLDEVRRRLGAEGLELARTRAFSLRVVSHQSGGSHAMTATWDGATLTMDPWEIPGLAVSSGIDVARASRVRGDLLEPLLGAGAVGLDEVRAVFGGHGRRRGAMSVCMHGIISCTVSHTQIALGAREVVLRYFEGSPCKATPPVGEWRLLRT